MLNLFHLSFIMADDFQFEPKNEKCWSVSIQTVCNKKCVLNEIQNVFHIHTWSNAYVCKRINKQTKNLYLISFAVMWYVLKGNGEWLIGKWIHIYILYVFVAVYYRCVCYQIGKQFTILDETFLLFFRSFIISVLHFWPPVYRLIFPFNINMFTNKFTICTNWSASDHRFGFGSSLLPPFYIKHKLICL